MSAVGIARLAHVAPVQDQPMVGMAQVPGGRAGEQAVLDFARRFSGCKAGAIADAEHVGIDGQRRLAEGDVQDHVRGLAPDPGQGFQRRAIMRHPAAVPVDQDFRKRDDVGGLGVVKADGLDVVLQAVEAQRQHLARRVGDLEQRAGRLVDARIRGLGRQHDGDQKRIGVDGLQLAFRVRIGPRQAGVKGLDLMGLEGSGFRGHASEA